MSNTTPFVLGVDLDGVCGNYTKVFRRSAAEDLGIDEADLGEHTTWSFATSWHPHVRDEAHFDELHRRAVTDKRIFRDMDEIDGVSDALWKLSDAGVHIRIITHRLYVNWGHDIVVSDTVNWLQQPRPDGRPRIPYRDIAFLAKKADMSCDMLIDDSPANIARMREAHVDAVVFDQPYNQWVPGSRAQNWDDAVEIVLDRMADRATFSLDLG